jgi:hypothetical protein
VGREISFAVATASWATVLTAVLAFAAACASWASVLQSRKQIRATLEPDLQVLIEGGQGDPYLAVDVRNTGGGTAKRFAFIASIGDDAKSVSRLGIGYMPPGHGVHIVLSCDGRELDDGDVLVVLLSSDTREFPHAWSHLGQHKVFRSKFRRRPRTITLAEVFEHFFPEINLEDRDSVGFHWRRMSPEDMLRSRRDLHDEVANLEDPHRGF